MSVANFNDTSPAAPAGKTNVKWQQTGDAISAYVDTPAVASRTIATTAPLTGGGDLSADRSLGIDAFTGDTGTGGAKGAVPAPVAGDAAAGKFIKADGTWAVPSGTGAPTSAHYITTQAEAGLSAETSLGALADNSIVAVDVAASVATPRAADLTDIVTAMGVQNPNKILAGPTTGSDAAPAFRALVLADLPSGQPYDLVCSLVGKPGDAAIVLILTAVRAVNFAANFSGSYGSVGANPAATATYTIRNGVTTIGTVAISTSGVFTFATSSGTSKSLAAGDRLTITAPTPQDGTLSDVGFTLAGTR